MQSHKLQWMQIDLANWFEVIAAVIAIVCWIIKPLRSTSVLALMLLLTIAIEFASKYLYLKYKETLLMDYIYLKLNLYSVLYNLVTLTGNLGIIYFLLNDKKKAPYIIIVAMSFFFIFVNLLFGQGYKTFNNYSTAFCWLMLVGFTLYKLRTYNSSILNQKQNVIILLFLLATFVYYTVNLPAFVFYHQLMDKNTKEGMWLYRLINDNANYPLYALLSVVTIALTFTKSTSIR